MDGVGPELLARLLDEHRSSLVLYARQLCDAPEDVVQEAFWRLARQPGVPDRVVGWLFRVVRNEALSASRAARRRRKHEAAAAEQRPSWFLPDPTASLDGATVACALESLPGAQREVIVARLWGGLTFEEISELVGTSTSTAHRTYTAALETLRSIVEEDACCPKKND